MNHDYSGSDMNEQHPGAATDPEEAGPVARRRVLGGIAAAGGALAATPLLSSCVVPSESEGGQADNNSGTQSDGGTGGSGTEGGTGGREPLVQGADVPAGGGVVLEEPKTVVTRGDDGTARAFSAVCTHQGCLVDSVADGTINCPCHGSKFDAATGEPVAGPAPTGLDPVAVEERDGAVYPA